MIKMIENKETWIELVDNIYKKVKEVHSLDSSSRTGS